MTFEPLLRFFFYLLDALNEERLKILYSFWHRLSSFHKQGIYEVLEHEATLELCDARGKEAIYRKRQKVRFLQDNVIAYQDQAWGDGDIFADYRCTPGIAVDRYREGQRYRILVSLRQTKNYGDIEEFRIERTILDGFTRTIEELQVEVSHFHHKLAINVIFPFQRPPHQMSLIEQNVMRTTQLSADHLQPLPDHRYRLHWETDKPRLFERYIVHWQW